jgi:hypothetical protein
MQFNRYNRHLFLFLRFSRRWNITLHAPSHVCPAVGLLFPAVSSDHLL